MTSPTGSAVWAGVDVGGPRKGFHVALVDGSGVVAGPSCCRTVPEAVAWLKDQRPQLVAVDSPRTCADEGCASRDCERELARSVCGIRWTPERSALDGKDYYAWIRHGRELYKALACEGLAAVECFPTASFTRWAGRRGKQSRRRWTAAALRALDVPGVPPRLNQDGRDSIAAALTARAYDGGETESFGPIVVPAARWMQP